MSLAKWTQSEKIEIIQLKIVNYKRIFKRFNLQILEINSISLIAHWN